MNRDCDLEQALLDAPSVPGLKLLPASQFARARSLDCDAADRAVRETKAALAKASGRDVVVRGGILAAVAAAKVPGLAAVKITPDWDGCSVGGQFDPQALAAQTYFRAVRLPV